MGSRFACAEGRAGRDSIKKRAPCPTDRSCRPPVTGCSSGPRRPPPRCLRCAFRRATIVPGPWRNLLAQRLRIVAGGVPVRAGVVRFGWHSLPPVWPPGHGSRRSTRGLVAAAPIQSDSRPDRRRRIESFRPPAAGGRRALKRRPAPGRAGRLAGPTTCGDPAPKWPTMVTSDGNATPGRSRASRRHRGVPRLRPAAARAGSSRRRTGRAPRPATAARRRAHRAACTAG